MSLPFVLRSFIGYCGFRLRQSSGWYDLPCMPETAGYVGFNAMSGLPIANLHPGFLVGPLSGLPSDNNGPEPNGRGKIARDDPIILLSPQKSAAALGVTVSTSPDPTTILSSDLVPSPLISRDSTATTCDPN